MTLSRRTLLLAAMAPALGACGMLQTLTPLNGSNDAADNLVGQLSAADRRLRFAGTTFLDTDDLSQVPPMGRLVSEQMANRLVAQHHLAFSEIRLTNALIMDSRVRGEVVLSRQALDHARVHQIDAYLLGTVSRTGPRNYVNARIVRVRDGHILAARSFQTEV